MAIYFKTIYGDIINGDFVVGICLETITNKMGEYEIRACLSGDDYASYLLYHTKDKKDAEGKFNEIINILEENGNKVIDLTHEEEGEDNESD